MHSGVFDGCSTPYSMGGDSEPGLCAGILKLKQVIFIKK